MCDNYFEYTFFYREYEETLDVLQNDIDTLEMEKLELKDRMKSLSKKTLLEGLQSRQNSLSGGEKILLKIMKFYYCNNKMIKYD